MHQLESAVQSRLESIQKTIVKRETEPKNDAPHPAGLFVKRSLSFLMSPVEKPKERSKINFYCDTTCTGCGICEQVCLSKKIAMIDGKPVWQKDVQCYFCYACFNFCPARSILVKRVYMKKSDRYIHPKITAKDIAGQK